MCKKFAQYQCSRTLIIITKYIKYTNMKIKLNDKELELVYSIRTLYIYEQQMDEPLDYTKLNKLYVILSLFYCNILATLQSRHEPLDLTWDDFIAWLDTNGGYPLVYDYITWFNKQLEIQAKLIKPVTPEPETKSKKKK